MSFFTKLGSGSDKSLKANSIVSEGLEIKGDIVCKDSLYVGGTLSGDIISTDKAAVEIGRTGKVFGTIKAETVVIKGVVEGDVVATSQLELGASAKVKGRLSYRLLKLEPGAVFEGELEHQHKKA